MFMFDEVHMVKQVDDGGIDQVEDVSKETINIIDRVISSVDNSKAFLSSGTFIVNQSSDFAQFANLIIRDKFPANTDWSNMDIETFNHHMAGYISYMEETQVDGVTIEFMGEDITIKGETFKAVPLYMSEYQASVYREAMEKNKGKNEKAGGGFYTNLRNVSQFAMPKDLPKNCIQRGGQRMDGTENVKKVT